MRNDLVYELFFAPASHGSRKSQEQSLSLEDGRNETSGGRSLEHRIVDFRCDGAAGESSQQLAGGAGQAALEQAAAANKFAFVFFWKDRSPQTDKAWATLQPLAAKMADAAVVAAVQVSDPKEKQLVTHYGLDRAPLPLVLAIAPCGAITKAFTGEFNEQQLQTAFVSPGTQHCLKALQDQKLVFVCVTDGNPAQPSAAVPEAVRQFKMDERFGPTTEVVLLNANDAGEAAFLQELKVDPRTAKPLTVFLAPPGSVIGQFDARATKDDFVKQVVAAQSNPCAGGKCGPGGCGPKSGRRQLHAIANACLA